MPSDHFIAFPLGCVLAEIVGQKDGVLSVFAADIEHRFTNCFVFLDFRHIGEEVIVFFGFVGYIAKPNIEACD